MTEQTAAAAADTSTTQTNTTNTGAATQAASIVSGAAQADTGAAATTDTTAADWRAAIAGEDKAYLKTLERYTSPAAYGASVRALQAKLSSGELKAAPAPFPEKGTPEEQAAWRKDQGIPDDPKEYKIELPNGIVLGEADKPGVERLQALAHKKNWTPAQLNGVMEAYYNELDAVKAARDQADAEHRDASDLELREAWKGADYKRNLQAINNFLDTAPKGVKDRLLGGRTADGKLIANDPVMLQFLAQTALEQNPAAALLPTGNQNMAGVGTRLQQLDALIAKRDSEYYKGPNSEALQKEYRDLIAVQERVRTRAA